MGILLPTLEVSGLQVLGMSFCTKCMGSKEESFNNVQMMLKIFSCYLGGWWTNFLNKSWNDGRWWLERFGMLEINIYFDHIQTHPKSILDGALGFLREYQRLIATQTSNWMCFDSAMLILNGMFLFYTTCCMATALYICIFTGFKPVLPSPWV